MPQHTAASLTLLMRSLAPVATRDQLRTMGVTPRQLAWAVGEGILVRLRRAHYALPDVSSDCALAVSMGARLGGLSAARSYGWWVGDTTSLHVSWPANGNVAKPGRPRFASPEESRIIVHHWRIIRESLRGEREIWRESPEQALAQVMLTCDRLTAVACADSAIRCGTLTRTEVLAVLSVLPERCQGWGRYIDGVPDSGLESIVRIWLIDRRIPFRLHARVPHVGEVDFLVGDSLITETDGGSWHAGATGRQRDYRRDTAAASQGYLTARFDYWQVMREWDACERQLLEHLARGDHRRSIR